MISTELLIEKANALIAAGNLTELQILQLSAIQDFANNSKYVVATIADLPNAVANEGRLVYVVAEEDFYFSRGVDWTTTFNTTAGFFKQSAYAWGNNNQGQLGDNTAVNKSSPVTVVGGITNWSQVSAGNRHSLGVANGIAYAWGNGSNGLLGTGGTESASSPVTVAGGITNWSQVSAGGYHSLGIAGGVAYAWGANIMFGTPTGSVGDGTVIDKSSPVAVIGGITDWSQVSAGFTGQSLGIANGIAYAWGNNPIGQLGVNDILKYSSPVTVVGGITDWSQVSAGNSHSLGIANGIAYAWGNGSNGLLGTGGTESASSPVTVAGGITNWSQVSAGLSHSLGIAGGVAYAWGANTSGQLGDGSTSTRLSPVTVVGGITNWSQVSAGLSHSLGVTLSGIGYGWGSNSNGRLGDNTLINRSSPVTVVGGITNWSQVSAGSYFSLAIEAIEKGFDEP